MDEIRSVITEITDNIDWTTTLFYQQKTDEGFESLNHTLSILSRGMGIVFQYQKVHNENVVDEQLINQILSQAMNAMEEKDSILLSDILKYDLKELLLSI